jgi:protein gp37
MSVILPGRSSGKKRIQGLVQFANTVIKIQNTIGFKVSARGWAYLLEQAGAITNRDMDPEWARKIQEQCRQQNVAFFFKQSSNLYPGQGRELDGQKWEAFP